MLTEELELRLRVVADEQPFVPDIALALRRARGLQTRRRASIVGALAAFSAVAAVGVFAVVDSERNAPEPLAGASAEPQGTLPVTLTTRYDQVNDVTCAVLTFTETGDNIDAGCSRLSSDKQVKGLVSFGDFGQARVHAGAQETTIVLGELAGGGTVVITDETGRQTRAAVVAPPTGYPYSTYYADLGTGLHWPTHIIYIAPNGTQRIYNMPTVTPSPSTSAT